MKKILALALFLLTSSSMAFECQNVGVEDIARELVALELSGVRITDMDDSSCLKQDNFKYVKVVFDAPVEKPSIPEVYFDKNKTKISVKAQLTDAEQHVYHVNFTVDDGNKKYEDSIDFFVNKDKEAQKADGCAQLVTPPTKFAMYKQCKK